nr:uncharacterized RING finger protein P4H10.07-like [Ipomoea trifida]
MECETPIDEYYCAAWEAPYLRTPELLQSSPSTTSHQYFYIRIDLEFLSPSANAISDDDDDEDFDPNCFQSVTKTEHFWAPCRRLDPDDDEKLPRGFVSGVLSGMGIPADGQAFFLQKISDCAEEIANAAHNKREKILPMIVSASVLVDSHSLGDHQQQQTNA